MPLEQSILAIGGLVLAVLVAAVVGGQIGRLVRRRLDTRGSSTTLARLGSPLPVESDRAALEAQASAAALARLGDPLRPPASPPVTPDAPPPAPVPVAPPPATPHGIPATIAATAAMASPDPTGPDLFPGVLGRRYAPGGSQPVFSIPTSSMSPAARDRAAQLAVPAAAAATSAPRPGLLQAIAAARDDRVGPRGGACRRGVRGGGRADALGHVLAQLERWRSRHRARRADALADARAGRPGPRGRDARRRDGRADPRPDGRPRHRRATDDRALDDRSPGHPAWRPRRPRGSGRPDGHAAPDSAADPRADATPAHAEAHPEPDARADAPTHPSPHARPRGHADAQAADGRLRRPGQRALRPPVQPHQGGGVVGLALRGRRKPRRRATRRHTLCRSGVVHDHADRHGHLGGDGGRSQDVTVGG